MRILRSQPQRGFWRNVIVSGVLLMSLFLIGLKLGTVAFGQQSQPISGAVVNPPFQVPNFVLRDQSNRLIGLNDLRGHPVVMFFGYTHCPDVCPTTLANFTQVKKLLGAEADKAIFAFVTVDGKRDTPEVLQAFLSHFDSSFLGLTGDDATLSSMAAAYGAFFSIPADKQQGNPESDHHEEDIASDNYFVQHTSPAYLIDSKGLLRMVYFYGTSAEVIAQGVQQSLQESR